MRGYPHPKYPPLSLRGTKQPLNYTEWIERFETCMAEKYSYEIASLSLAMTNCFIEEMPSYISLKYSILSLRGTKQPRRHTRWIGKFETCIAERHSYELALLSLAMKNCFIEEMISYISLKYSILSLRGTKQPRRYTRWIGKFETCIAERHNYEVASLSLAMTNLV